MTSDLLTAMVASARRSALERERIQSRRAIEEAAAAYQPRGRDFRDSLTGAGVRIIAECKRRSPSRGVLRDDYDPAAIAASFEAGGAAAISVLTESAFFDGSLDHLREVRAAVALPLLRKDFIVTEVQLVEARAAGADAVLLIAAALDDRDLKTLLETAESLGLGALVEVHDEGELERSLTAGATIVGVNSRNLRTLEVDTTVLDALAAAIPDWVTSVAESGLKTPDDLRRLRAAGYDAFLIGERFMSAADPGAALRDLKGAAESAGEATA